MFNINAVKWIMKSKQLYLIYETMNDDVRTLIDCIRKINDHVDVINLNHKDGFDKPLMKDADFIILDSVPITTKIMNFIEKYKIDCYFYLHCHPFFVKYSDYNFEVEGLKILVSFHSTKLERQFLYEIAKRVNVKGTIVEIGSLSGGTTIALALGDEHSKNPAKIVSIDLNFPEYFDYALNRTRCGKKVLKVKMNSQIFYKEWKQFSLENEIDEGIKILWIDGDHSYHGCKNDIENYSKYLVDGGVIVLHDFGDDNPVNRGVTEAIEDTLINDNQFSNFIRVGSIFYAEKNVKKTYFSPSSLSKMKSAIKCKLNYNETEKFYQYLKEGNYFTKKIILYGLGSHTKSVLTYMNKNELKSVVAIIDDGENLPEDYGGIPIYKPEMVKNLNYALIIPSSSTYEEKMINKLMLLNVSNYIKIYTSEDFYKLFKINVDNIPKSVLLTSRTYIETPDELDLIL